MKNLLVFIIFCVGIFQASDSNAQSMTSYFNERPRETLQFHSPAEKFSECVASTG